MSSRSLFFWDVTQSTLLVTDVFGQPTCPIFKDRQNKKKTFRVSSFLEGLTLADGTDSFPEQSVEA